MSMSLSRRQLLQFTSASAIAAALPAQTASAAWPERAITAVNGYTAGGGSDFVARALAEPWGKALGSTVNVINRVGSVCSVACDFVASKPSDGYWWLMCTNYNRFLRPMGLQTRAPWQDWQWFRASSTIMSFAVQPSSPAKTFADLLDMAKKKPGELRVGNSGAGGVFHLGMALVEKTAGIKVHHVAYQGDKSAILALLQGEVDAIGVETSAMLPLAKDNQIRLLCSFTPQPFKAGEFTLQPITDYVPAAKQHAPYGGGLTPSIKNDTDPEVMKQIESAFWQAQKDEKYVRALEQRGIAPAPTAGKEAQRDCALSEVVTAVLMHELGLAKADPVKDLNLPPLEGFDEWWAKQQA